ncbi:MAG: purine-nucleoside phosphorylase [Polyangiaceae bacterium]|nr:purine-nucleoside phosphorylase [Polyangiaceae bacterium]
MDPKTDFSVVQAAAAVRAFDGRAPLVGAVLGSGLGDFVSELGDATALAFASIPGMPASSVAGHAGKLWLGTLGDVTVACLAGRVHSYEGHPPERVVFGARLLAELGCKAVIVTNAAGGIRKDLSAGDLLLIRDHLNLSGQSPLVGPAPPRGERFVDMTRAYDPALLEAGERAAFEAQIQIKMGVYASLLGPSYETPAEVRMLGTLGADAVGMSTVLEVLALRQLGVRVGGLSLISNQAAGISQAELSHAEVQATALQAKPKLARFMRLWIKNLAGLL